MPDANADFGWLFPAKLWEHRATLRRKRPFVFWTSILMIVAIILFVAWALTLARA